MDLSPESCGIGATFDRCHLTGAWRVERVLDHNTVTLQVNENTVRDEYNEPVLFSGDEILEIDSQPVSDLSPAEFAKLIMGPENSSVAIKVRRTQQIDTEILCLVAVRKKRTIAFDFPLSPSAEGLKAVFNLLHPFQFSNLWDSTK